MRYTANYSMLKVDGGAEFNPSLSMLETDLRVLDSVGQHVPYLVRKMN